MTISAHSSSAIAVVGKKGQGQRLQLRWQQQQTGRFAAAAKKNKRALRKDRLPVEKMDKWRSKK